MHPPLGVWAHISGSDLVRDADGTMYVLEDNLRVPSGVSYLLENRLISKRAFADLFQRHSILPVDGYTDELHKLLRQLAPPDVRVAPRSRCSRRASTTRPTSSTPSSPSGWARTSSRAATSSSPTTTASTCARSTGPQRVDVIYRRIDDLFLDPEAFLPDSALGVPGLLRAWKAGNVGLANAPGAGVADDKVVYAWVPDIIRYYLGEEPLHPERADVPLPDTPTSGEYVLDHIGDLVVKPANESGGYGLLIGNRADRGGAGGLHRGHRGRSRATGWRSRS